MANHSVTPTESNLYNDGENWPKWSTPQREIEVLRATIHAMARDINKDQEQELVDHYIARERTK